MDRTNLLTVLCYSAGVQSHGLLRMVCAGLIPKPRRFSVVCADPGMESLISIDFRDNCAKALCEENNIPFVIASGPNLYRDLLNLKNSGRTRIDNPPFWTKNDDGSRGQLTQSCTKEYKIAPLNRAVRRELYRMWGIHHGHKGQSWIGSKSVEKWIGFTLDERERADRLLSQKHPAYLTFRFPLIELEICKTDLHAVYREHGWEKPIMSICNGCPFHGLRMLKDKHDNRPSDWAEAVAVDESIRDLTQIRVTNPCYVSDTLIPLKELAQRGFQLDDPIQNDLAQCSSGICFT